MVFSFRDRFGVLPIYGMIHLAGERPVAGALQELEVYAQEGVDCAIVENYHGSVDDVEEVLRVAGRNGAVKLGVNILPNEYRRAFDLVARYGADFIQLDYVAGRYVDAVLDVDSYTLARATYLDVAVVAGVWPKYYTPVFGSNLGSDLQRGMQWADAIVVTGEGTGKETPLDKIKTFRNILGEFPLLIGAGLTPLNAFEQLCIADGGIVGSCFKQRQNTANLVDQMLVRDLMDVVREVKKYKADK